MKIYLLIGSLVLNANQLYANPLLEPKTEFNALWSYNKLTKHQDGSSVAHTKSFIRYLYIGRIQVPVAQTHFTYLINPKEVTDLNQLAKTITKSFGTKKIKSQLSNKHLTIEGDWDKINRHVKLEFFEKSSKEVLMITSFSRMGFNKWLIPEVNGLHAALSEYTPEKNKTSSFFHSINVFGIRSVHAQPATFNLLDLINGSNNTSSPGNNSLGTGPSIPGIPGLSSGSGMSGVSDSLKDINGKLDSLQGVGTDFNANLSDLNITAGAGIGVIDKQGTDLNNNLNNLNNTANSGIAVIDKQGTDFNNNLNNMNNTANSGIAVIDKQGTDFNKNLSDINKTADNAVKVADKQATDLNKNLQDFNKNYADTNANWAESNKILAKTVDPNHMAKVAFYTAAGAALGSVAVSLAIDGVSAGIQFLHELFTGEKRKKLEWEDFQRAMQVWDTKLNDLVQLEKMVDQFILAFNFFEMNKLGNDYMKNLNVAIRDMKFDRDIFMEKFKDGNIDMNCRRIYYNAADEMDNKIKDYEKVLAFASNNTINFDDPAQYFCSQLKDLQRKILGAEMQMQDLRLKILMAEDQVYSKQTDEKEKRQKKIKEINSRLPKNLRSQEELQVEVADDIKDRAKKEREQWIDDCVDAKNPEGEKVKKEIDNWFFHFFKAKGMCKDEFNKKAIAVKTRSAAEDERLKLERDLRKDLQMLDNDNIALKMSDAQMNWLNRLHLDSYCYQFAHQEEEKLPKKCTEYPELLYSLSLSKGAKKAEKQYKDKCEDRYLKGLQQLSQLK